MKLSFLIFCAFSLVLSINSCSKIKHIGKWEYSDGSKTTITYIFEKDGTAKNILNGIEMGGPRADFLNEKPTVTYEIKYNKTPPNNV